MTAIEDILGTGVSGLLRARAPRRCPYRMPQKKKERAELSKLPMLPKRLRALSNAVIRARRELNEFRGQSDESHNPYHTARAIEEAARTLDELVRRHKRLPKSAIVEYEAGWRFSVTSLAHERMLYKKRPRAREKSATDGPGFDESWRNRPPEIGHICFSIKPCKDHPPPALWWAL
jgi:hypothetical protein